MYITQKEKMECRAYTTKMIEGLDEGIVDPYELATELLEWLSEDEVEEFAKYYDYIEDEDEDDEDDEWGDE